MSPATFVMLSGLLTFGVPLALALRELVVLRRPHRRGGEPPPPPPQPKPMPRKPLPDCLVPRRQRVRELEDA